MAPAVASACSGRAKTIIVPFTSMKISSVALAVSVVVNLGLLAVVLNTPKSAGVPDAANSRNRSVAPLTPATTDAAVLATPPVAGVGIRTPSVDEGIWSLIRTDDLEELVRRLKAAGFPPAAIQAIVYEQVRERFQPRMAEILGRQQDVPYWKAPNQAYYDPKNTEKLNALYEERDAVMKKLFGPAYWEAGETDPKVTERRYGNLSPEKIAGIQAIVSDYQELFVRESRKRSGPPSPAEQQKWITLQKEEAADIAKLLTPDELFEYELRSSTEASRLLSQTKIFQPTEAEFRALFPLYRAMGESLREQTTATPGDPAAVQRAEEQLHVKIKELLGPERFADYLQAKDPASEKLNRIVQRLELPLSAATAVVAVQKEVTQRADAVKSDRSLTPAQRQEQLSALAEEATTRITGTLGERGFGAYQQYSGKWLQALQPKPSAAKR
jgi:hypothetical protein